MSMALEVGKVPGALNPMAPRSITTEIRSQHLRRATCSGMCSIGCIATSRRYLRFRDFPVHRLRFHHRLCRSLCLGWRQNNAGGPPRGVQLDFDAGNQ